MVVVTWAEVPSASEILVRLGKLDSGVVPSEAKAPVASPLGDALDAVLDDAVGADEGESAAVGVVTVGRAPAVVEVVTPAGAAGWADEEFFPPVSTTAPAATAPAAMTPTAMYNGFLFGMSRPPGCGNHPRSQALTRVAPDAVAP
ncbi:hypothetical protein GCM10009838_10370 [Catenulispora subtropica]|uniref:Uncharacterized protein n=1 Tax=Catenulispora subtropica TaxID=450798 RepID=A0ABP5C1R5_9ACTN